MRRSLALAAAAAAALRAAPARGEPLDASLARLGVPDANVLCRTTPGCIAPGAPEYQAAADARQRFAIATTQLGLAVDSFILAPANTVGHSGFELTLEAAYAPATFDPALFAGHSPFKGEPPSAFVLPALHVRKALPYSFEVGGRAIYLNQSTQFATQVELKWAINEGIDDFPDVAVRGVATRLFGIRDLDLGVYGLDALVSKRFGIGGVMSLTPYGAARLTWVWARSGPIQYGDGSDPATAGDTAAAFPELGASAHRFWRFALGLRLIASALTVSLEGTYTLGKTFDGPAPASLGPSDYPTFEVPAVFSGAANFGLTF
ncbi:MAG TPA: hypothetical protein VFR85_04810 [Anaeromyxobacteraceae bacterium]|nr:hypothetical protein [Anaeromyxobacteraceae bacterium]